MLFGKKIKELRENKGLLQRQLSAQLDIDTPLYSKFERGERLPKREQISFIANILNSDEIELRTLWLADKVIRTLDDEREICYNAIKVVHKEFMSSNLNE